MNSVLIHEPSNSNLSAGENNITGMNAHTMSESTVESVEEPMVWEEQGEYFAKPGTETVLVRTKKYLRTRNQKDKKLCTKPIIMKTCGMEIYESDNTFLPLHIIQRPESQFHNIILNDNDPNHFWVAINLVLSSMKCASCTFFLYDKSDVPEDDYGKFEELWDAFINGTDEYRNSKFKLYPKINGGSWLLRKMVPNVPTILGQKVPITYHRGENYLELDILCDKNRIAYGAIKMAYSASTTLIVDLNYILQVDDEEELPEIVFAGVSLVYIDLTTGTKIESPTEDID